jgi:HK97 family phage major capsid protein
MSDTLWAGNSAADHKARQVLEQEAKAIAFEDALEIARNAPQTARDLAIVRAENKALKAQADRPVHVTVSPPKEAKRSPTQVKFNATKLAALAAYGGMKRHIEKGHVHVHVAKLLGDRNTHQHVIRDATQVASTTSAGWGAELTTSMSMGLIEDLVPTSAAAQLIKLSGLINFQGANSLTWAYRADNAKGSMGGVWTGEGATLPVTKTNLRSVTLSRHKLGSIATASGELVRTSNPSILALIEDFIKEDTSIGLDTAMFDPNLGEVAAIRPSSLTYNAPNSASSGGSTLTDILVDIKWLRQQMSAVNATKPAILIHSDRFMALQMVTGDGGDTFPLRDELARTGGLFGVPILHSPFMNANHAVAVDAARLAVVSDGITVDTSTAATLAMADDDGVAPTMADTGAINDNGGSIHISDAAGVPPTPVRSMFQTDSVAIRLVWPLTFKMVKPGVAYRTNLLW